MIKSVKSKEEYFRMFQHYHVFENFINYVFLDLEPTFYVDNEENPNCIIMYSEPAFFVTGNPEVVDRKEVFHFLPEGAWIVFDRLEWYPYFENECGKEFNIHNRTKFDESTLNLEHIRSLKKELPEGLRIETIKRKHTTEGIIWNDVVSRFYTKTDFFKYSFGYVLLDEKDIPQGFCLANHPSDTKEVELYFRVGYDNHTIHRGKGLGIQLCVRYIEECLLKGYKPIWDAAHEVSSHIAKKLGYVPLLEWKMYNIK